MHAFSLWLVFKELVFKQYANELTITVRWYGELPSEPALSEAKGRGWH